MDHMQGHEQVVPLDLGIAWDAGAPEPVLLQTEDTALLVFHLPVAQHGPQSDAEVTLQEMNYGIITWRGVRGALLGPPNDEALQGHRFWRRGLREIGWYASGEVLHSKWIQALEQMNRVHPKHDPQRYATLRHFILGFHDSVFECIATAYSVQTLAMPIDQVITHLLPQLLHG